MLQKTFKVSSEKICRDIVNYTIGFANITLENRVEDAECAGSGTLVTIGSLHGILTAAHVIDEGLPKKGRVGLVQYLEPAAPFQKFEIQMEMTESVMIRAAKFGPDGPDLAFLKLPDESVSWLKAKNSFYNLPKYRDDALAYNEPAPSHIDCIVGMIAALTEEVPTDRKEARKKRFTAIFGQGEVRTMKYVGNMESLGVTPISDPEFGLPENYQGTSGGALWRFYIAEKDGNASVVGRRLIGVPFYQSSTEEGVRIISCQGPRAIYQSMIDAVSEKWPREVALAT